MFPSSLIFKGDSLKDVISWKAGQIQFCDSPGCICNYNWCLFSTVMDLSCAVGKAIYELMGKIKNKHKALVIKKQVDPKWWLMCKSLAIFQMVHKSTAKQSRVCRQAGRQAGWCGGVYTHVPIYTCEDTNNTADRRLQRPLGVFNPFFTLARSATLCF